MTRVHISTPLETTRLKFSGAIRRVCTAERFALNMRGVMHEPSDSWSRLKEDILVSNDVNALKKVKVALKQLKGEVRSAAGVESSRGRFRNVLSVNLVHEMSDLVTLTSAVYS